MTWESKVYLRCESHGTKRKHAFAVGKYYEQQVPAVTGLSSVLKYIPGDGYPLEKPKRTTALDLENCV